MSSTLSSESSDGETATPTDNIDVLRVFGNRIGNLAYTTELVFHRTAGLVGGSILPQRAPAIEVKERGRDRLVIIVHDQLSDNLRSLLKNTPLGRELDALYHSCYRELYSSGAPPIESTHELQLTAEQSAQLSQALLLLVLNYSNRPM